MRLFIALAATLVLTGVSWAGGYGVQRQQQQFFIQEDVGHCNVNAALAARAPMTVYVPLRAAASPLYGSSSSFFIQSDVRSRGPRVESTIIRTRTRRR